MMINNAVESFKNFELKKKQKKEGQKMTNKCIQNSKHENLFFCYFSIFYFDTRRGNLSNQVNGIFLFSIKTKINNSFMILFQ